VVDGFAKSFSALLDTDLKKPQANSALIAPRTVRLLPMPTSQNARLIDVLGTAKISIDLEIYQLQDRGMVAALSAAAARGVRVRVMLEPKTVGSRNFDAVSLQLAKAKIEVKPTPDAFNTKRNVDHAKFCIVDGKELLLGTGNWARSSVGGVTVAAYRLRDFWIEDGRPKSIAEAQAIFDADYTRQSSLQTRFEELVVTPDNAAPRIVALIDSATKRLYVENQSINDVAVIARLLAAKSRGVDVRVLLGYQPGFAGAPAANDPVLQTLKAAKIQVSYLKRHYLHAKGIVADNKVYLGSQNFTSGGLGANRELGIILDDAAIVREVQNLFEEDMLHAND
jgi:cardiolipin synthase A/B